MKLIKSILARKGLVIVALCAVTLIALSGAVLGKYLHDEKHAMLADTTPFYFTCNFEDGGIYYLSGDTAEVTVFNHDGLEHITKDTIAYTVSVTDPSNTAVATTLKTADAGLTGNTKDSATYEFHGIAGGFYKVTVQSTAPYAKEITFQINFMENDVTNTYSITVAESKQWLRLDLYIGATPPANDITVVYGILSPNNTNDMMSDWLTGTEVTHSNTIDVSGMTDHSHYSFIFFGDVSAYESVTGQPLTDTINLLETQGGQS
jgi:hypothetical protein